MGEGADNENMYLHVSSNQDLTRAAEVPSY